MSINANKNANSEDKDDDDESLVTTINKETFRKTLRTFLKSYFDKHSAKRQKQYLRNHIRKPRALKIRTCSTRLREINGYFKHFPDAGAIPMSEDELVDILLRMIPVAWKKDLLKSSDDPADSSLTELEERLVRLEQSHDENQVSEKKGKKGKKNPKSDEDSSGKKGKKGQKRKSSTDGTEKRKGKFCHYCDLIGGRSDTHYTKDCRKKTLFKDGLRRIRKRMSNLDRTRLMQWWRKLSARRQNVAERHMNPAQKAAQTLSLTEILSVLKPMGARK